MPQIYYIRSAGNCVRADYEPRLNAAYQRLFPDNRTFFFPLKRSNARDKETYYYSCGARLILPDIYKTECFKPVPSSIVAAGAGNFVELKDISLSKSRDNRRENPTVLHFCNPQKFLAAYRARDARPDTEFNDIRAAVPAEEDMLRNDPRNIADIYMTDIKQWINDPEREALLPDQSGRWTWRRGHDMPQTDGDAEGSPLNPLETYAYYIGLSLNRPHNGGVVYLRYFLSFSATYMDQNVERIRKSFERGLWKSLPEEVQTAVKENRLKFSVQMVCTEATAYAVAAMNRYLTLAKHPESIKNGEFPDAKTYETEFQNGGLFYAPFDMGGGSLDTAFGLMTRTNNPAIPYEFKTLQWGGEAFAGCENILEEAAFRIFNQNWKNMTVTEENGSRHIMKCAGSREHAAHNNRSFIGKSAQAQFNSRQMTKWMRDLWMEMGRNDEEGAVYKLPPLYLLTEKQALVTVTFHASSQNDGGKPEKPQPEKPGLRVKFEADANKIRDFFRKRIERSMDLFLNQCSAAVNSYPDELGNKTCYILLGGNACRSRLVKHIVSRKTEDGFEGTQFKTLDVLPTAYDEELEARNESGSLPTAKSGVVYGILKYLSDGWCHVDETARPHHVFHYHIGMNYDGNFHLLASADELSANKFAFVGIVDPMRSVSLRYTRRPEYGLRGQNLSSDKTSRLEISVEPQIQQTCLFCRSVLDSDCKLEFFTALTDSPSGESDLRKIGTFDLSQ